jgi:hypothetical protein
MKFQVAYGGQIYISLHGPGIKQLIFKTLASSHRSTKIILHVTRDHHLKMLRGTTNTRPIADAAWLTGERGISNQHK